MKINVQRTKEAYRPGTRIELIYMDGETRYSEGDTGTVTDVDDMGTIHMRWDKGGSLGLIPGQDIFRVITDDTAV